MTSRKTIEGRQPGLKFRVIDASKAKTAGSGRLVGKVSLECEISNETMWEVAIHRLNGLKLFNFETEAREAFNEVFDQTAEALDRSVTELEYYKGEAKRLEEEVERLRSILGNLADGLS